MTTSQTTNLHLTKAVKGTAEPFSIDAINANLDTIDAKVGAVGSTDLQSQVTALSESAVFTKYTNMQVTNGAVVIQDSKMKSTSTIIACGNYASGSGLLMNYFFSAQADNGQQIIYVRNPNGSNPANGTIVNFSTYVKY